MLSAPRVVVYAVVVAYLITVFLPLTHLLLATREAQFSSAHSRPIAKDFVDGKRSFYNNLFTIDDVDALLGLLYAATHEIVDNC